MINEEFSISCTETLAILNNMENKYIEKISKKFIDFLEDNKSKEYNVDFDFSKPLKELNLRNKTQTLLGIIYLKYWANEEEKTSFRKKMKENEIKYQEELREKYNPDVFKNRKK